MCGIFGYIGRRNSAKVCLDALKRLEYRGYDSSGIAGISDGKLLFHKESGKLQALEKKLEETPLPLELAIAHTRWATHGKPSQENAHPHFDENNTIALVHNGIIENHQALRKMLIEKGVKFRSETDSEVIAQLVAHFYEGELLPAVQKALALLRGFWGIALIHKDHPDKIIAAARENPISIALSSCRSEAMISSDANAFQDPDFDVLFLHSDEVAVISPNGAQVYDQSASPIDKQLERLQPESQTISKNGFEHFMLKEIFDQPHTIQQAMHGRCIPDFGTVEFEHMMLSAQELLSVGRILILGCGTSWHAGCIAATMIEDLARIPTQAEIASEFRCKNPIISEDTLVIAISQSGETLDTIAAVREAKSKGAKVLAICNVRNSTLTRDADACIFLRAGAEVSVCSTKAFTSQLTVLFLFTLLMARLRHLSKEEGQTYLLELQNLPGAVHAVLQQKEKIEEIAKKYAKFDHFFFLGRHYMFPASLEASLKLKEISYLHAMAYPAGEMKHGPISLVCPELAVVTMCGNRRTIDKMLSNMMEIKARGGQILAFAPHGAEQIEEIADDTIFLPDVIDELAAIPYSVATQLLAYFIAKEHGTDIDQPRNLAKSVTVE
jgi:glucosamine--fructose-6-phosphate aminotransferase (isomerizing)